MSVLFFKYLNHFLLICLYLSEFAVGDKQWIRFILHLQYFCSNKSKYLQLKLTDHIIIRLLYDCIMKELLLAFLTICFVVTIELSNSSVGYKVGKVEGYKLLRNTSRSALYEVISHQLDDNRPMKLINLYGTNYQVGYDYGYLLAEQINESYHTFVNAQISNKVQLQIVQTFLDFQFEAYVKGQLPIQFLDQLKGISHGSAAKGYKMARVFIQRVLVISSFPGDIGQDIATVLFDQFLQMLRIKNPKIKKIIEDNLRSAKNYIKKFIKRHSIHCSFFGIWGKRTNNRLFTMRNLDWQTNTGVNKNKLITVYHIKGKISHFTLGYPGVVGALTGMSSQGITVHEAGLSSIHQSQMGFQWTLRLRYIMMNAHNLQQAISLWKQTNNTLGMNFMIGSANDGKAVALETMRAYTAFFYDEDSRQNGTIFTDHKGKTYRSGFSMKDTVFRTNHAYDPQINKGRPDIFLDENSDTMIRYFILKDGLNWYQNNQIIITQNQALNMTAVLGDKGTQKFLSCKNNDRGLNTISVLYQPKQLKMWVAFQYGFKQTFRSACCGTYVEMDMGVWLKE